MSTDGTDAPARGLDRYGFIGIGIKRMASVKQQILFADNHTVPRKMTNHIAKVDNGGDMIIVGHRTIDDAFDRYNPVMRRNWNWQGIRTRT